MPRLTLTTSAAKLFAHRDRIVAIAHGIPTPPITLAVAPTSRCQMHCEFCLYRACERGAELSMQQFVSLMAGLPGVRGVEFTGGEPLLWEPLPDAIRLCSEMDVAVGIKTNGLRLPQLPDEAWPQVAWVRVSLNAFEIGRRVPHVPNWPRSCTLSGSYVWHENSTADALSAAAEWCREEAGWREGEGDVPLRLVFDEWLPHEHPKYTEGKRLAQGLGALVQERELGPSEAPCFMPWIKPYVAWDGWVYACCNNLPAEFERKLPVEKRICRIEDAEGFYLTQAPRPLGCACSKCLYADHNEVIRFERPALEHLSHV